MRAIRLLALFCIAVIPCIALAGDPAAAPAPSDPSADPAIRPLAQASTKAALGETKLPEQLVSDVYADMQIFAQAWAARVLNEGNGAARGEDLRAIVDSGLRDKLQARGIGITQQEAIIDAMRLRAEAAMRDFGRMTQAQAAVKLALEASGTEEPALSEVFDQIKDFAADAHAWVEVPGVGGGAREPAAMLVESEIGPLLDTNEFPDKHRAATLKALAQWLEARAAVEGDAQR